ncbi:MAG: rhodanese-like domain-containing protein [Bacteroidales bacterium]|nr:rhodanese-like domain-containing protein [Bacteroidales bacterium]
MITSQIPLFQEFHIEGVQHITPQNALAELQNGTAILIDVREEPEFKLESIPLNNVFYYPLSGIVGQLANIPTDKPIIVICNAGVRSSKVVNLLNRKGFPESANLDGGIIMWKAQGLQVESDLSTGCGCGCSCPK